MTSIPSLIFPLIAKISHIAVFQSFKKLYINGLYQLAKISYKIIAKYLVVPKESPNFAVLLRETPNEAKDIKPEEQVDMTPMERWVSG